MPMQARPMMPPGGGGPMGQIRPQMPAGAFQGAGAPVGQPMPPNAQAMPGGPVPGGFPPMGGGMMPDRAMLAQMLAGRMQGR